MLKTNVDKLFSAKFGSNFVVGKLFQFRPVVGLCQSCYLNEGKQVKEVDEKIEKQENKKEGEKGLVPIIQGYES